MPSATILREAGLGPGLLPAWTPVTAVGREGGAPAVVELSGHVSAGRPESSVIWEVMNY